MSSIADGQDPNTGNPPGVIMNSLPSNVATRYIDKLTFYTNLVTNLEALVERLSLSTLDEYSLISGDASTRAKRKDLKTAMSSLEIAMSRLRYYEMKVYGRGLMTMRLRRKS